MTRSSVAVLFLLVLSLAAGPQAPAAQFPAPHLAVMAADAVVMATKTAGVGSRVVDDTAYYYRVTDCDGVMDYRQMTNRDARDLQKKQQEQFNEAAKTWKELKAKWAKVMGSKSFPVSPPKTPTVAKTGSIPGTDLAREKETERQKRHLEVYDVCIVKNVKGEKTAESIRHDKVYARGVELDKEYADAAMAWADAHKDDKDQKAEGAPVAPAVVLVKGGVEGSDVASKLVEKLTKKLQEDAEKKAADDAARDKAKDAADKKPAEPAKQPPDKNDAVKEAL